MVAYDYYVDPVVFVRIYNGGNLLLAITGIISHIFLCYSLLHIIRKQKKDIPAYKVWVPVVTNVMLATSSICGLLISNFGTGLVYW